ncbi:MAG: TIGR02186 family protein [Paracoccaceae bacterium]
MRALAAALVIALAGFARAEETIVTGLSDNRVAITANYTGTEILIYGAIKRDAPAPSPAPIEVIITVEGPSVPLTIRRKAWVAGLWINRDTITVDASPSFYAVATTGAIGDILSSTDDLRYAITIGHAIEAIGSTSEAADADQFVAALQRIQQDDDRFRLDERSVFLTDQTLFRTDIRLPADLTEGNYKVRLFLTREGKVIDHQERILFVRKAGLEKFVYDLAHDQPLLYGLLSLLMAVAAGWAASAAAQRLRR